MIVKDDRLATAPSFQGLESGTVYRTPRGAVRIKIGFHAVPSAQYCISPEGVAFGRDINTAGEFVVAEILSNATLVLQP